MYCFDVAVEDWDCIQPGLSEYVGYGLLLMGCDEPFAFSALEIIASAGKAGHDTSSHVRFQPVWNVVEQFRHASCKAYGRIVAIVFASFLGCCLPGRVNDADRTGLTGCSGFR